MTQASIEKKNMSFVLDWAKTLGVPVITLVISIYGNRLLDNTDKQKEVLDQIQKNQIEFKIKMESFQELQEAKNQMFERELQGIKRELELLKY
jgi:fatty acid-binding protein DegV